MSLSNQMHLEIKLDDQATFDNFYAPKGSSQQLANFYYSRVGKRLLVLSEIVAVDCHIYYRPRVSAVPLIGEVMQSTCRYLILKSIHRSRY